MLYTGSVSCLKTDLQIVQGEREETKRAEAALAYLETEEESIQWDAEWLDHFEQRGRIQISAKLIILGFHNMCLFFLILC
jgi:hypothetical protein